MGLLILQGLALTSFLLMTHTHMCTLAYMDTLNMSKYMSRRYNKPLGGIE